MSVEEEDGKKFLVCVHLTLLHHRKGGRRGDRKCRSDGKYTLSLGFRNRPTPHFNPMSEVCTYAPQNSESQSATPSILSTV